MHMRCLQTLAVRTAALLGRFEGAKGECCQRGLSFTCMPCSAGLVPPAAAVFLMGRPGAILITTMLFMAVTSAGSAELVAVSSLFTYDIYRTYINPKASGAKLTLHGAVIGAIAF